MADYKKKQVPAGYLLTKIIVKNLIRGVVKIFNQGSQKILLGGGQKILLGW